MVGLGHIALACAPDASARTRQQLAELGARFREVPMSRMGLNPAKDFLSLLYIIRMLKKEKPDLLLTYTIKPVIYGSLGGWVTGVPRVFSMITGLGYLSSAGGFRQRLLLPWVRMILRIGLHRNKKIFFSETRRSCPVSEPGSDQRSRKGSPNQWIRRRHTEILSRCIPGQHLFSSDRQTSPRQRDR